MVSLKLETARRADSVTITNDVPIPSAWSEVFSPAADSILMITPINTPHVTESREVPPKPVERPAPQAQTPKSGTLSHDQVTLKSAGQPDHDADGK
jgi:hypothetical protein